MKTHFEKDGNQLVCTVLQKGEILGQVVMDSTVQGHARGGVRMLPDVDEAELRGLARVMTLKYGFVGVAEGGAKAGLRVDPEAPQAQRQHHLAAFGKAIAPLLQKRVYIPSADMGTNLDDVRFMLQSAGIHIRRQQFRHERAGYHTARTVFVGVKETARHLKLDLAGRTAAIEGFGKVGSALAEMLAEINVRVVAVSTSHGAIYNPQGLNVKRLVQLAAEADSHAVELYDAAEHIDKGQLLELPVDILCPCARHHSIHSDNVQRVAARIISPGANIPATLEAERILFERNVICLPDFVANCGGVLGGALEFASLSQEQIIAFMDRRVGARVAWLLNESAQRHLLPREIAESFTWKRIAEVRQKVEHPTPLGRLLGMGLELYRRGLVPRTLVAALSLPYLNDALA